MPLSHELVQEFYGPCPRVQSADKARLDDPWFPPRPIPICLQYIAKSLVFPNYSATRCPLSKHFIRGSFHNDCRRLIITYKSREKRTCFFQRDNWILGQLSLTKKKKCDTVKLSLNAYLANSICLRCARVFSSHTKEA